jgi:lipopolysaccharide biosynthesis glycosyltransferase
VTGVNTVIDDRISRPVVLACDEAYGMQLATTLRSIVESNRLGWPLDFHVLFEGVSEGTLTKVHASLPLGSASIRWIPVDLGLFREFSTQEHISTMTYARFVIPRLFPPSVSRVLYLDTDLLVLDNLEPLWCADLEGAVVGAVLDRLDSQIKAAMPGLENVPRVREYFNAGVLLIDLDRWREERISERSREYLLQHPFSPYSDQDALNVACDGHWSRLDPRWNFQAHLEAKIAGMAQDDLPGIVHFVTRFKPWKPSSVSANAALYDAFRSRTAFARTSGQMTRDALQGVWYGSRRILGRSAVLRAIRDYVTRADDAEPPGRGHTASLTETGDAKG